jgi:hypothetical protein
VPVVTTSTSLKATSMLLLSTSFFISSAVKTWASPFLIFSLISSIVRLFCLGLSFVYLQPMPTEWRTRILIPFGELAHQSFQGSSSIYSFKERIVTPLHSFCFNTSTRAEANSRFVITGTLNSTACLRMMYPSVRTSE